MGNARSRLVLAVGVLGFASGLPNVLVNDTLSAWLSDLGFKPSDIGLLSLLTLPYGLKLLWAPLLDRFEPRFLGRRRAWLLITQLLLAAACWAMASFDPKGSIGMLGVIAVSIAFLSASQDVVFDAYRADLLEPAERGAGAAVSVLGYRLAMLVSGGLALILADQWLGWPNTFRAMGVLFVAMAGITLLAPRTRVDAAPRGARPRTYRAAMPCRRPASGSGRACRAAGRR